MYSDFINELLTVFSREEILCKEPMKLHTTFRIGGVADYYVAPNEEQLKQVLALAKDKQVPVTILGNGSNLLVKDGGIRGLVIEIGKGMSKVSIEGTKVYAKAGAMLARVSNLCAKESLTGLEFASGIPGTIGGAIVMNAGAYGGEMKDVVTSVEVLTMDGDVITLTRDELELSYRHSVIPERELVVLSVVMELAKGKQAAILEQMEELRKARVEKQPLEYPSAGSTFKRPEGFFAGKLISDVGMKGYQVGGAQVSEKHAGFVINKGDATAQDVLTLMQDVSQKVREEFSVELEAEVKIVGE